MQNRFISHRNTFQFPLRFKATWLALFLCFFCAFSAAFAPSAHAQNTTFLYDNDDSFSDINGYYYQGFTVNSTTTFDLRYTPDYESDCVILTPTYLNSFVAGGAYRYVVGFDGRYGTTRFNLAPGKYYLAIRNEVDAENSFSYELDYAITSLAADSDGSYAFSRWGISGARYVAADGGIVYHGFSTTATERVFLDGCNSGNGVETYVIPSNQLSNLRNGRTFTYYTSYSGEDGTFPGIYEITLPVGSYYLVFINNSDIDKSVTYKMEYWKRSNPLYLDMQTPASWSLSGTTVTMNVAKIINTSATTTSGSLRLSLWALPAPYTGVAMTGVNMANLDLKALLPGYQYTNIRSSVRGVRPTGTYYTALILNEYTSSGWRIVDWVNMASRTTFDAKTMKGMSTGTTTNVAATGTPNPDSSIVSSPLPATRTTAATKTRNALSSASSVEEDTSVVVPETVKGTLSADVLVGKGRLKPKTKSASPNPSAGSS